MDMTNAMILEMEPQWFEREVKKAVHIWVAEPTLTRDGWWQVQPAGGVEQHAEVMCGHASVH